MSMSGFLKYVPGQSGGGATVNFLLRLCFVRCLLLPFSSVLQLKAILKAENLLIFPLQRSLIFLERLSIQNKFSPSHCKSRQT